MLKINGHPVNLSKKDGYWHGFVEDIPVINVNAETAIKVMETVKKQIELYDETIGKRKSLKTTEDQHANGFLRTKNRKRWSG